MVELDHRAFHDLVEQAAAQVGVPGGPPRRTGAEKQAAAVIGFVRRDLAAVRSLRATGKASLTKATDSVTELALELTSLLFAAGADHAIWRGWSGLAAFGLLLLQKPHQAAHYACLGGEWALLGRLPTAPVSSRQLADRVLWRLVGGTPVPELPDDRRDDDDTAWLRLARSIPARDDATTEEALAALADFWIAETEGDWQVFHPRSYPDFEVPPCVAAALARHQGFQPAGLTDEQRRFLEAGLATPEPTPWYPTRVSWPEPARV